MANMIGRLFDKWAGGRQRKDLETFVATLRRMDDAQVGFIVASATDVRHRLAELHSIDLMDPVKANAENPKLMFEFTTQIFNLQRKKKKQEAAVLSIWVHTLRVVLRPELGNLCDAMWIELARGFPHIEQAVADFKEESGVEMNTAGATDFPVGMTPKNRD
ncbi:MAG: hypothetical protein HN403_10910 [Rhodospirillales bacterium]|jgi:hypothetical protein|nr:hypothetical protein [Rhodospirillales bacterium]